MRRATSTVLLALLSGSLWASAAVGQADGNGADPMAQPARIVPLADDSLLLDVAVAGELAVAVGHHGVALYSEDGGQSWTQGEVPIRSTLTGVHLHDARRGWAVGHDAAILRTDDGGRSWTLQQYLPDAETPLLDVWFRDSDYGIAVGAYGFYFVTSDGGQNWEQLDFEATEYAADAGAAEEVDEAVADSNGDDAGEEEELDVHEEVIWDDSEGFFDYHLNRIAVTAGGRLYIAAEAGHLFRSDDEGETWVSMPSPYEGSFFGAVPLDEEALLLFGLRGHLFRSDNGGETWREFETTTTSLLTDGVRLSEQQVIVGGLAGAFLVSSDGGSNFEFRQQPERDGVTALEIAGDGSLLIASDAGISRRSPELTDGGQH